jgi:hypothetical protein
MHVQTDAQANNQICAVVTLRGSYNSINIFQLKIIVFEARYNALHNLKLSRARNRASCDSHDQAASRNATDTSLCVHTCPISKYCMPPMDYGSYLRFFEDIIIKIQNILRQT